MGISIGVSNSSYDRCETITKTKIVKVPVPMSNPNPKNFLIIKHEQIGIYLLIEVKYPDSTNYEGHKIMIFECTYESLLKQMSIDPHFSDNPNFHSPIARFEPTKRGWEMGKLLVHTMIEILK